MADDARPALFPDQATLENRARAAGVDLDALSDIARLRLLTEFRTEAEQQALAASARARLEEDARRYNAHLEQHGFWNAEIKPW